MSEKEINLLYVVLQCSEIQNWKKFAEVIDVLGTCARV